MLAIIGMAVSFTACSSDDDDIQQTSEIEKSYNILKNGIIGKWKMESYWRTWRPSDPNPYINNGWNDASKAYSWTDEYELSFDSNGYVTYKNGEKYPYTITLDNTSKAYYTLEDDSHYYPFKTGVVILAVMDTYNTKYLAEIKNDGKLYLYDESPLMGKPTYRYTKQ